MKEFYIEGGTVLGSSYQSRGVGLGGTTVEDTRSTTILYTVSLRLHHQLASSLPSAAIRYPLPISGVHHSTKRTRAFTSSLHQGGKTKITKMRSVRVNLPLAIMLGLVRPSASFMRNIRPTHFMVPAHKYHAAVSHCRARPRAVLRNMRIMSSAVDVEADTDEIASPEDKEVPAVIGVAIPEAEGEAAPELEVNMEDVFPLLYVCMRQISGALLRRTPVSAFN